MKRTFVVTPTRASLSEPTLGPQTVVRVALPTGALVRTTAAFRRYGWRAVAVLIYRVLFRWPRLRSAVIQLKVRCLVRSTFGPQVQFGRHVDVHMPSGEIHIGSRTMFSDRCVLSVSPNPAATLRIGHRCYFAPDVHLCASGAVTIGDDVRVGEFTSIRDTMHRYRDKTQRINAQGDRYGRISIGDDVWVGRGCLILGRAAGLRIGHGAVVGANSVVRDDVPDYAVVAGAPARVIGYRR